MPQDALEQLLRAADATAAAPPLADDLPAMVRRRRSRSRQRRAAAAATVAVLLVTGLTAFLSLRPSPQPQLAAVEPPVTTRDLQLLELQAALHEQTAARLLASRPARSIEPSPVAESVLANVRQQRDRAALILIYEADQAARQKQTDRALAAYRRTIDLFPTTYWAGVARQRLKEMPT